MGNMGGASFNTMGPAHSEIGSERHRFMRQCAGLAGLRGGDSARK